MDKFKIRVDLNRCGANYACTTGASILLGNKEVGWIETRFNIAETTGVDCLLDEGDLSQVFGEGSRACLGLAAVADAAMDGNWSHNKIRQELNAAIRQS